jgi:hypothetical protein
LVPDEPPDPVTFNDSAISSQEEVNEMAKAQEVLYALVGAGDFTMQKVRDLSKIDAKGSQEVYEDFVKRGKRLSTKVRNSASTKRAIEQTKTAQTQVKAAATSVGKAIKLGAQQGPSKAAGQTKAARTRVKAATTSVGKAVKANAKATRTAVKAS